MQKCTRTYFIRSGSLTEKELDKYTDHHHFQCKYLSKKNTIQSTVHHYYNTTGVDKQQSEDSADSTDEEDEEESENGEYIVLNEFGDESESEAEQVSFTRSGRSTDNKRRMESDWLFY